MFIWNYFAIFDNLIIPDNNHAGVAHKLKCPFLFLLIVLISGILCGEYFSLPVYALCVSLISVLLLILFKCKRHIINFLLLFCTFLAGLQISPSLRNTINTEKTYKFEGRCDEVLNGRNYILSVGEEKFLLNNFDTDASCKPGDSLKFYTQIRQLQTNSNNWEFSYPRYLKHKKVFYKLIPQSTIEKTGHSHGLFSFFIGLREKLLHKTERLIENENNRSLINAVCLGFRNEMDDNIKNLFISTGTIHLLAVSGLHTGAIYLLIFCLLKHIGLTGRKTELIIIPLIWGYACLTGLSPSVIRAATILSFITFGKVFSKSYTPLNFVAASAFFTLIFRPETLYSVSFQMSYSAYTGILLLYPVLYKLPGQMPRFVSRIYSVVCLSIAAQLATLPISAYYFHTININGFLINIIAIPLATLLLYSSTIMIILPLFISKYIACISDLLSEVLIKTLQIFQPLSINLTNIYPHPVTIILIYLLLISLYFFILSPGRTHWLASAICITMLFLWQITEKWQLSQKEEVVIFHTYKHTSILLNYKGFYSFLKNNSTDSSKYNAYINSHKLQPLPENSGLLIKSLAFFHNNLTSEKHNISIIDGSDNTYKACKTLIITNNRMPSQIFNSENSSSLPTTIITDGSNTKSTANKWEFFCKENAVTYLNTFETGSIRLCIK